MGLCGWPRAYLEGALEMTRSFIWHCIESSWYNRILNKRIEIASFSLTVKESQTANADLQ